MDNAEFIKHLQEEKLRTQSARTTLVTKKLAFAVGLLGLGLLKSEQLNINFTLFLYVMPFVALVFDLYILGEDYSVKRIGAFLSANSSISLEQNWEKWVGQRKNRDKFAPFATPFLTTILSITAAIAIWITKPHSKVIYWIWVSWAILPSWLLCIYYDGLKQKVLKNFKTSDHLDLIENLKDAVKKSDYTINENTYKKTRLLFLSVVSNPQILQQLCSVAPEYEKQEYLRCVDNNGKDILPTKTILEDYREMLTRYPEFKLWFQEKTINGDKHSLLLPVRWLCHLVGFRHICVHVFIDHPSKMDQMLVQVRSFNKSEYPGCFDLPAAGHVKDLQKLEYAVYNEIKEELGLVESDILDLKLVAQYNYHESSDSSYFNNTELRIIFQGRLDTNSYSKISFQDKEVAAIAVFDLRELKEIIRKFPDRVASGLAHSFEKYKPYQSDRRS